MDLIRRQDAIDALGADPMGGLNYESILGRLPSAEQKPKTGKWIYHQERKNIYGGMCIECSECREEYMVMYIEDEKYCRNCGSYNGAKMEEKR